MGLLEGDLKAPLSLPFGVIICTERNYLFFNFSQLSNLSRVFTLKSSDTQAYKKDNLFLRPSFVQPVTSYLYKIFINY
jgi:hypothetical protein